MFSGQQESRSHTLSPPPYFESTDSAHTLAVQALAQSYLHWGFLAWSILGSLTTIILMKLHYEKGGPLAPRTLLFRCLGRRYSQTGLVSLQTLAVLWLWLLVPSVRLVLGLQVGYGLEVLFDIPNTVWTQSGVVFGLMALYTVSALTGVSKGIQILSRINIGLGLGLLVYMLLAGPTGFILSGLGEGLIVYGQNFVSMSMYRGDTGWLGWWTVFFWGWFGVWSNDGHLYCPYFQRTIGAFNHSDDFPCGSVDDQYMVYHHRGNRSWTGTE